MKQATRFLRFCSSAGSTYYSFAKPFLDLWASLQNSDGSWYQQYNPYSPYSVVAQTSEGTDGNLKVDSGAALLAWAMSYYDQLTSGTRYKTKVQTALNFLRQLQYAHTVAHSSNLIANIILDGTTDTTALLADCAECLLSAKHAMDAYGVKPSNLGKLQRATVRQRPLLQHLRCRLARYLSALL